MLQPEDMPARRELAVVPLGAMDSRLISKGAEMAEEGGRRKRGGQVQEEREPTMHGWASRSQDERVLEEQGRQAATQHQEQKRRRELEREERKQERAREREKRKGGSHAGAQQPETETAKAERQRRERVAKGARWICKDAVQAL